LSVVREPVDAAVEIGQRERNRRLAGQSGHGRSGADTSVRAHGPSCSAVPLNTPTCSGFTRVPVRPLSSPPKAPSLAQERSRNTRLVGVLERSGMPT
jgi:hypothetical protein